MKSNIWYLPGKRDGSELVFPTESRKVELVSLLLKRHRDALKISRDEDLMPHYGELKAEKDGFLFLPYEMANWSSSWAPSPPYLTKTIFDHILLKQDLFLEMNPKTAKELGLKEGDQVEVSSPLTKERFRVHLFEGVMPGVVHAPLGFGHVGYDEFLKGKGVNIAKLLWATIDPVIGSPIWWGTKVNITRVS
jgi:anaerobic selenocysteine-containing dehydrogenase